MPLNDFTQLIFQTLQRNSEYYEEISSPTPTQIKFITVDDEPTIITDIYTAASYHDLDILEFTMHSKITRDEDSNFITTMTFTFIQIDN